MTRSAGSGKAIKVLVFFATNDIGGPGKGLFQLIRNSQRSEVQFTVCNFKHPNQDSFEFLEYAREHDIDIQLITQRWSLDPLMVFAALKVAKAGSFDVVQSHDYKTHLLAWIVSRRLRLPWLALSHGWTAENMKIKIYNALQRFLMRWPDTLVAVSPRLLREAQKIRRNSRTVMILNAIERAATTRETDQDEIRGTLGIDKTCPLIGVFGRLSYEKGQDQFIEAFRRLPPELNARAILVGSGPAEGQLRAAIAQHGLADRIHLLGYQTDLHRYYQAVDLTVLPSRSEGLPNVILEAQALGRPVIAFGVGGVTEIIEDQENGWVVAPADIDGLCKRMRTAIEQPELRQKVARCASERLFPKFSVEGRCQAFLREYESLLTCTT